MGAVKENTPAKRLASGALCLCMLLALLAGLALAVPAQVLGAAVQNGTGGLQVNTTVIGFGGKEWYVVGYDGAGIYSTADDGHATLLLKTYSTEGYGTSQFRIDGEMGQLYSNHYTGSTLYSNGGSALQTAMTNAANSLPAQEKALIAPRTLSPGANEMSGDAQANQYFWPLSETEITTLGRPLTRAYDSYWWTRTPFDNHSDSNQVEMGDILNGWPGMGRDANSTAAVRPAFSLDLANVIFTSAAAGTGAKATASVGGTLDAASAPDGAVKLTVFDSGLTFSAAPGITGLSGRTLTFGYTPAAAGSSGYDTLSAVVRDSAGNVKYYGRLSVTPPSSGTPGTASVTVPDEIASGDVLSVFIEQVNGDDFTDFASALAPLSFTNQAAPAGLGATDETAALNDGTITGLTPGLSYEYKLAGASRWTAFTGGAKITGLAGGSYQVRLAADGGAAPVLLASPVTTVTVAGHAAPPAPTPTPKPTPTPTPTSTLTQTQAAASPQTGDGTGGPLWALCGAAALAGLAATGAVVRRRVNKT